MFRRYLIASIGLVLALSACGSDSKPKSGSTSSTLKVAFACPPTSSDCTSEEVISTVAFLLERGGATRSEATCLAPITAKGKSAVSEAFEVPTQAQTAEAIACVGSVSRLLTIATDGAAYIASHPNG